VLAALAAVTDRLGLAGTINSTFNEPYEVARQFASLDHLSGGRAAWNVVTSWDAFTGENFRRGGFLAQGDRYERARTFLQTANELWDSWHGDEIVADAGSGQFLRTPSPGVFEHHDKFFDIAGQFNVPRSPQGRPVIFQAGDSGEGRDFAAASADAIFSRHSTLDDGQAFYADVKGRLAAYGRDPDHLKIMPGVFPVVGRTEQEAEDKFGELQDLIHPEVGLSLLSGMLGGVDLSGYPVDGPLPDLPESNGGKSRQDLLIRLARREELTIRQLYLRIAGARGHRQIRGTPETIADELEAWFRGGAADGFNIMPPMLPGSLDDFVELVIPELQRRGLFRTEYEGRTLRENLGLPRPAWRPRAAPPEGGWAQAHAAE
jgi:alkanesulfonate monooxygenase